MWSRFNVTMSVSQPMRDDASAAGRRHPAFADWLRERGLVGADEIDEISRGLLGSWLRSLGRTEPVARVGDSILVYRVPAGSAVPR